MTFHGRTPGDTTDGAPTTPAMPFFDAPDALGRPVRLEAAPRRIVSLVPSQTELLADLGLDVEVVGLTRFCIHPDGWKGRKTIVGGTKTINVPRVASLAPDLVIANKEENPRDEVEAVAAVAPVYVTDVADVVGALAMIRALGPLVARTREAEALADEVERQFATVRPLAPPLRALYLIWRDPWMTVGGDTFVSDVMARAGLANVAAGRDRYPVVSDDEIAALAPEVVLLSSEPYPFGERHVAEVEALAPGARVVPVDGEAFSWFGSRLRRTPAVLEALSTRLRPAPGAP